MAHFYCLYSYSVVAPDDKYKEEKQLKQYVPFSCEKHRFLTLNNSNSCHLNLNSSPWRCRTETDYPDVLVWVSAFSLHQLFWLKPFIFLHLTSTFKSEPEQSDGNWIQQSRCEIIFLWFDLSSTRELLSERTEVGSAQIFRRAWGREKQSHHILHNVTAVWCALGIFKSEVLQTGIKCANFISDEAVNSAHLDIYTYIYNK